jgi:hypothetical protein
MGSAGVNVERGKVGEWWLWLVIGDPGPQLLARRQVCELPRTQPRSSVLPGLCPLTGRLGACYSESPEFALHPIAILKNCGQ